jgi:tagatose 6-phosphate kinase
VILTVTLNPAWDITHSVGLLEAGNTHRVSSVGVRPGGKGVNVSRVLQQQGYRTVATGLVAGATGAELRRGLVDEGLQEAFFACAAGNVTTRRTVTVVETASGRATVLTEPGPAAGSVSWPDLRRHVEGLIDGCELVVLTGSLPPAVPADAYRDLVAYARRRGVPSIVDAVGAALVGAVEAGPDLVKPNLVELADSTGESDPVAGGRLLIDGGARKVVVSAGPDGLYGVDETVAWHAQPASLVPVNPTGAGDAAVAALAVGMLAGSPWPELLRVAVAWSAAAVLEPQAGVVDPSTATRLLSGVSVKAMASGSRWHGEAQAGPA